MRAPSEGPGCDVADGRESQLSVRLFGSLDIGDAGGRRVAVDSARMRSLLGFLILHGGVAQSRQHVAFSLWPDSAEAQARTNLRKLLHRLRADHPELAVHVAMTTATVCWRPDECWVDVASFREAVAAADSADPGTPLSLACLRTAVGLYSGDFLEDCHDEWALEARERLRDTYLSALRRLVAELVAAGAGAEAVELGRRLVRGDPLRDDSYRLLMRAHAAGGDRAAAVRVYHECVSTLERELAVAPSTETAALCATFTQPAGGAIAMAAPPPPRSAPLVGRDDEWSTITESWMSAESGTPELVVVTGEPGIGKTRLVEELATWSMHRGAIVARGQAYAGGGDVAYGVASSWLRAEPLTDVALRADATVTSELAVLLPELRSIPAPAGDTAEARRRLFEAVARLLEAAGRPVLLVADDAHWCDAPTVKLVHYLLRRTPQLPVLVAATVRREDLDADHPLLGVAEDLALVERAAEVELSRLTRTDTEALVRDLLAGDVAPAPTDDIYTEAEGNPLFVVELLRAGRLGDGSDAPLPMKLRALIDGRLRRLAPTTRDLAGLAATVGRGFSTELLRACSGLAEHVLAGALDDLWRRGVIRDQAGDSYDFTHAKIREVAYGSLGPAARRHNHAVVADALQRVGGNDAGSLGNQVAVHYDRAGRAAQAITWYLRAAQHAQRVYADADAVRLLERARALVAELPVGERPERELEVLTAMPAALVGLDGFASTRLAAVQRRALDVATQLGVEPDRVLLRSLVMTRLSGREFEAARDAAERLARAAQAAGDEALAVESDYLLGITAFWGERLGDARCHFERVVERFDPACGDEHLVRFGHDPSVVCLSRLGNTFFFLGDDGAARRARDDAVEAACRLGHPYTRGAAYGFGILLSIDLDETGVVRAYLDAMGSAEPVHGPIALLREAAAGYVAVLEGDIDGGMRQIATVVASTGGVDSAPGVLACLHRVVVATHEAAGDPVSGLPAIDEALAAPGSRLWEAEIRRVRAEFLASAGRPRAEVAAELAAADDVAGRQGAVGLARRLATTSSRLAMA